jgi:hypothetical protein
MGQYFTLVNTDKNETVEPPGTMKAIERLTNKKAMGLIGYLVFQGPQDGTRFTAINSAPLEYDEAVDALGEDYIGKRWENRYEEDPERTAHDAGRIAASHKSIREANEYAGRWAGDGIALVGDYDDSGLYKAEDLTDITDPLIEEFVEFVGEDWWDGDQDTVMRPDMVFNA